MRLALALARLRLRLLELGGKILAADLRAKLLPGELMFRRLQRAFGLLAVDLILPRVDVNQRLALLDELIVGHVERDDVAGDARRDDDRAAVGVGVVGALDVAIGPPVIEPAKRQQSENHQTDDQRHRALFRLRGGLGGGGFGGGFGDGVFGGGVFAGHRAPARRPAR